MSVSTKSTLAKSDTCSPNSQNPYVFLVGSPRSGTTMLKRMVSAHPLITISRETHWIPRVFERRRGMTNEGVITEKTIDKLFEHHRFEQMKTSRDQLIRFMESQGDVTYAQLVSHLFDNLARRRKKPLAGDKTPNYVRKLPTLWQLWPESRAIHIVRDGRDTWLSLRNWRMVHKAAGKFTTWSRSPVVTSALWWKALVGQGYEDGRVRPSHYFELKYESLVAQPELHCRKIADFLLLPYDDAMPRYFEGKTDTAAGSANSAWLPPTPGLRDWRVDMPEQEQRQFEWAAGDLLRKLGYPTNAAPPDNYERSQIEEVKREFTEEVVARGWRLPQDW